MDYYGKPQTFTAVTSGVLSLYWTLLSVLLFLGYRPSRYRLRCLLDGTYSISTFHVCVYMWGVLAASFYFFSMLFNIVGGETLRVLNWLAFSTYVGWIYFAGLGISCGYTWHKHLANSTAAYLAGASLTKFAVSLLAFINHKYLSYFISAFNLVLFSFQLLCVYRTMRTVERESHVESPQQSEEIYSQFRVMLMIFITLSLLFGIECVGTYMYGDGMKQDNPFYFLCFDQLARAVLAHAESIVTPRLISGNTPVVA